MIRIDRYPTHKLGGIIVFDIDYAEVEYGYKMDGEFEPASGSWFNKEKILLDPYAKSILGKTVWGELPDWEDIFKYRGRIAYDEFENYREVDGKK